MYTSVKLGYEITPQGTWFRVFAKDPQEISLVIYESYDAREGDMYPMTSTGGNLYQVFVEEDVENQYYMYRILKENRIYEIVDPYAKSTGMNSHRGAIIDPRKYDPEGFRHHKMPEKKPQEALIYEGHIKDLTMDPNLKLTHPGKYLALAEDNFVTRHLQDLGITHLHLLPVQDFGSVDELDDNDYNWGYDPVNYFTLEGSYSVGKEPGDRIREFKEMVQYLHSIGIGVVIDVVYNHTYITQGSVFDLLASDVYYRKYPHGVYSNGSGVGNELKTEEPIVSKLILESLLYFIEEYKVDGFRFDLWALMDRDTTDKIVKELKTVKPDILLYGEPWSGGESQLPLEQMTTKGVQKGKGYSLFNDTFRHALKGSSDGFSTGILQGNLQWMDTVAKSVVGSRSFFTQEPWESINYISCHDNYILRDKLERTGIYQLDELARLTILSYGFLLFSFGIPFLHGGVEFLKTKNHERNPYNGPWQNNVIDWKRTPHGDHVTEELKKMVALRKKLSFYTRYTEEDTLKNVRVNIEEGWLWMRIRKKEERYVILWNPLDTDITLPRSFQGEILYEIENKGQNILPRKSVKIMRRY